MPSPLANTAVRLTSLLFALASAALLLYQLGYSFETGDQLQYLLLPYRQIFRDFLPGDWFTWHTSHYHVSFAWLVRAIHAVSGPEGFARGMLLVHCLNLVALGWAILRLARALGFGLLEASCVVLSFACLRQVAMAGALLNHAGLVPADLALAPFLLACAAYAERRPWALGAWLGVSGLLHANYAVLGPLVLLPLALVRSHDRRGIAQLVRTTALFALIASPSLVLMFGTFLTHDSAPAAVAVTLFVRSPHHYDLSSMRADDFYFTALVALLGAPYWRAQLIRPGARSASLPLAAVLLGVLALGLLGSGLHIVSLARLFAWRMSVPLLVLGLFAAASTLRRFGQSRNGIGLAWCVAGGVGLVSFAQRDPLQASPWDQAGWLALGMLLAFACATLCLQLLPRRWRWLSLPAAVITLALGLHATRSPSWGGHDFARHFLAASVAIETPGRKLFSMVRERTPQDARFLIPPGQTQFRLQARRAVFVDWKCAPMKGDEALEWQRRMLLSMGVLAFPARGYALPSAADALYYARPLRELTALARAEGLTHLLVRRSNIGEADHGAHKLFSLGDFVVFAL